jgi:hypothetical protein
MVFAKDREKPVKGVIFQERQRRRIGRTRFLSIDLLSNYGRLQQRQLRQPGLSLRSELDREHAPERPGHGHRGGDRPGRWRRRRQRGRRLRLDIGRRPANWRRDAVPERERHRPHHRQFRCLRQRQQQPDGVGRHSRVRAVSKSTGTLLPRWPRSPTMSRCARIMSANQSCLPPRQPDTIPYFGSDPTDCDSDNDAIYTITPNIWIG